MRNWWKWLLAVPVGVVVFAVVATFVYVHVVEGDAPDRLALNATSSTPSPSPSTTGATTDATSSGTAGTWTVTSGSRAGYRVDEVLFGQRATAVGRTSDVTGSLVVGDTTVTSGSFTVDMTTVRSDQTRRDNQFNGRIMDVAQFPTATFTLTQPIDLGSLPADGQRVSTRATGRLTLRGTTKTVTIDVDAQRSGAGIEVASTIPITFDEWGIPNPSFGPAQTDDHGEIELLLVLVLARS
jgi:polyisoprenoid-binding protein YceI